MKKTTRIPTIDIKKYGGKQVALVDGNIVASGHSTKEVLERARKRVPKRYHDKIWLFIVPRSLTVVYRL